MWNVHNRTCRPASAIKRRQSNLTQEQQLQNLLHYDIIGNPLGLLPDGVETRLESHRVHEPTAALFALLLR